MSKWIESGSKSYPAWWNPSSEEDITREVPKRLKDGILREVVNAKHRMVDLWHIDGVRSKEFILAALREVIVEVEGSA